MTLSVIFWNERIRGSGYAILSPQISSPWWSDLCGHREHLFEANWGELISHECQQSHHCPSLRLRDIFCSCQVRRGPQHCIMKIHSNAKGELVFNGQKTDTCGENITSGKARPEDFMKNATEPGPAHLDLFLENPVQLRKLPIPVYPS